MEEDALFSRQSSDWLSKFSQEKKSSPFCPDNTDVGFSVSNTPSAWVAWLWNEADSQGLEIQKYFPRAPQPVCNGLPAWKMMEEETTTGEGEDEKIWHRDTHKGSMTKGKGGKRRIRNAFNLCWCCCFATNWPLCCACGKCHLGIAKHKHHEWCNHSSFILEPV